MSGLLHLQALAIRSNTDPEIAAALVESAEIVTRRVDTHHLGSWYALSVNERREIHAKTRVDLVYMLLNINALKATKPAKN